MDDVARIMVNRSNMQYNTVRYAILRALNHMKPKITRLQPVVAEMGDRLATIHMCRKMGLLCPFPWGAGSPPNTDRQDNGPVKQGERFYKRSTKNRKKPEMWANAQRDGRPAEYRWRLLFNAAKFG